MISVWGDTDWVTRYGEVYAYNDQGSITDTTRRVRFSSDWLLDWRTLINYDERGNRTQVLRQLWVDTNWVDRWRWIHSYDLEDRLETSSYLNSVDGSWQMMDKISNTYSEDGLLISQVHQVQVGSQLLNDIQYVMGYTARSQLAQRVEQIWDYDGEFWTDQARESFDYDDQGNKILWSLSLFDGGEWESESRTIWEYDTNDVLLTRTDQLALSFSWLNLERQVYETDEMGRHHSVRTQEWGYDDERWFDKSQVIYQYDAEGRLTEQIEQYLNTDSTWTNDVRSTWFYSSPSGIAPIHPVHFSLQPAWPNPFNPSTNIRFSLDLAAPVKLAVYTIRGEEVARLVNGSIEAGTHQRQWQGRDHLGRSMPAGVYLIRLMSQGQQQSHKVLLLR